MATLRMDTTLCLRDTKVKNLFLNFYHYLRRRIASEGIMPLGVTLSRCVCVRRAAVKVLHSTLYLDCFYLVLLSFLLFSFF